MVWKKIPPEADYFHCEPGTDYYICEEGFVLEGRYLQDDSANLDKAIWPTVQGSRAYIRVRRKGVDKKFQLVRIFVELFPELLGGEVQVRTRKGPFQLHIEAEAKEAPAPSHPAPSRARKETPPRRDPEEVEDLLVEPDSDLAAEEDDDEDVAVPAADVRLCKVCNLRKRASEFSPRDDMPLFLQPKLLRAVEQKQIERVGGSKPIDIDIRIIAATNQDLETLVAQKQFRADLFYRLGVATIHLPPLRERKEDLPLLAEHFLARINPRVGVNLRGVSREGMNLPFGEAQLFLDLAPKYHWGEVLGNIARLDATYLMSVMSRHPSGLYLLAPPSRLDDLQMATPDNISRLLELMASAASVKPAFLAMPSKRSSQTSGWSREVVT